jgi:GTPase SAR1 family protein
VIVVEGPDGAGKTTLAKGICEKFDLEYRRPDTLTSTQGPVGSDIVRWWHDQFHPITRRAVYDRAFWVSELMYQPVMRGRPLISDGPDIAHQIFDAWEAEPMVVFCLPPWEVSREIIRAQSIKLAGVNEEDLEKIHWGYHAQYALWSNALFEGVISWDFTKDKSPDYIYRHVQSYLERHDA